MLPNKYIISIGEQFGPQHLPVDDLTVRFIRPIRVDDIQFDSCVIPFASIFNIRLYEQKIFSSNIRVADVN